MPPGLPGDLGGEGDTPGNAEDAEFLAVQARQSAVAAITGQERGFFLIPALIPFAVIAICAVSIAVRRPLTGVLLSRVSGGPADWREIARLRRVYTATTLAAAAVNVVNATVQAIFYVANNPAVLAAAHVATGPVFAVIAAVTVVLARRAMSGTRRPPYADHGGETLRAGPKSLPLSS